MSKLDYSGQEIDEMSQWIAEHYHFGHKKNVPQMMAIAFLNMRDNGENPHLFTNYPVTNIVSPMGEHEKEKT